MNMRIDVAVFSHVQSHLDLLVAEEAGRGGDMPSGGAIGRTNVGAWHLASQLSW